MGMTLSADKMNAMTIAFTINTPAHFLSSEARETVLAE
jgi:hypothetical protein